MLRALVAAVGMLVLAFVPSAAAASGDDRAAALFGLAPFALGTLAVLAAAVGLARVARQPKRRKPKRKSFDAGYSSVKRAPLAHAEAMARLHEGTLGTLVDAQDMGDRVIVSVKRRRGQSCAFVSGGIARLFEGAWARDVVIEERHCGGRARRSPCVFVVAAASPGVELRLKRTSP